MKFLRNVALAKERIRMDGSLCCNDHICITDLEIQAASLFPPHTEYSYIFIVTRYCINQIPLCHDRLCLVSSKTSDPELRGHGGWSQIPSQIPGQFRAGTAADGLQVAYGRNGAQTFLSYFMMKQI